MAQIFPCYLGLCWYSRFQFSFPIYLETTKKMQVIFLFFPYGPPNSLWHCGLNFFCLFVFMARSQSALVMYFSWTAGQESHVADVHNIIRCKLCWCSFSAVLVGPVAALYKMIQTLCTWIPTRLQANHVILPQSLMTGTSTGRHLETVVIESNIFLDYTHFAFDLAIASLVKIDQLSAFLSHPEFVAWTCIFCGLG